MSLFISFGFIRMSLFISFGFIRIAVADQVYDSWFLEPFLRQNVTKSQGMVPQEIERSIGLYSKMMAESTGTYMCLSEVSGTPLDCLLACLDTVNLDDWHPYQQCYLSVHAELCRSAVYTDSEENGIYAESLIWTIWVLLAQSYTKGSFAKRMAVIQRVPFNNWTTSLALLCWLCKNHLKRFSNIKKETPTGSCWW